MSSSQSDGPMAPETQPQVSRLGAPPESTTTPAANLAAEHGFVLPVRHGPSLYPQDVGFRFCRRGVVMHHALHHRGDEQGHAMQTVDQKSSIRWENQRSRGLSNATLTNAPMMQSDKSTPLGWLSRGAVATSQTTSDR